MGFKSEHELTILHSNRTPLFDTSNSKGSFKPRSEMSLLANVILASVAMVVLVNCSPIAYPNSNFLEVLPGYHVYDQVIFEFERLYIYILI